MAQPRKYSTGKSQNMKKPDALTSNIAKTNARKKIEDHYKKTENAAKKQLKRNNTDSAETIFSKAGFERSTAYRDPKKVQYSEKSRAYKRVNKK